MQTITNPFEAVQLIPIFNYINILSDFLFIDRCIAEEDQNRQIPIVNGLYTYIHNSQDNEGEMMILIRNILKGSDLYGAKENEYPDVTFVNAMIEHIITSLVFDKFGGIYGFLAKIILYAKNLQIEEVLNTIKKYLEIETFENENGEKSRLSSLAASKIFNDIILPLFPMTEANLTLLSLDYIYAQAGLIFLQAGRTNTAYFNDFRSHDLNVKDENLFDQYLVTGQVIRKLVSNNINNSQLLKAFALPALTYYIYNSKYMFLYENIANEISNKEFWQKAYGNLFRYTTNALSNIKLEIQNDMSFKMHKALSNFKNCATLAENVLKKYCPHLNAKERRSKLHLYLHSPNSCSCIVNQQLPNPTNYFKSQIKNITELFETYYSQLVENIISNQLSKSFQNANVIIKLLVPYNTEEYENLSEKEKFDILEFYFPNSNNIDYYILKQKDNHLILTNENDNPKYSLKEIKIFFELSHGALKSVVLKDTNENITSFLENLTKFKKTRFEAHLKFADNCQGEEKQLRNYWWNEFGLFMTSNFQCSTLKCEEPEERIDLSDLKNRIYEYPNNLSMKVIKTDTKNFLTSLGTSMKSVFLRNASSEVVTGIVGKKIKAQNDVNGNIIFEDIALNHNKPTFQLSFVTKYTIALMETIISNLSQKINLTFKTVQSSLAKISTLKTEIYRGIGKVGENGTRLVFVNSLNNHSDIGYGYKFIFLSGDTLDVAQFRTGYDFKDERLIVLKENTVKYGKVYATLNNITLLPELDNVRYEVNNQLRRRWMKVVFSGIPIENDDLDENCNKKEYFENWKNNNRCRRRQRYAEKTDFENEAIKYAQHKTNLTQEEIENTLKRYSFPNKSTIVQHVFDWVNGKSDPAWSEQYQIDFPSILNRIRFDLRFETRVLSNYEALFRIRSLYSTEEQKNIQDNTTIETILKSYNQQKGMYSLSFHDYYAIRNFATKGFTRITSDTNEAKLMKLALYKLAIRQSEDPTETFNLKLFRVEPKPISLVEMLSAKNFTTFQKFTETFVNTDSALRFAGYPELGCTNVLYEMIFLAPPVGVKLEKFYKTKEMSVILLPGSKFKIVDTTIVGIGGLGKVSKIKLIFQNSKISNIDWYKNIMREIVKLSFY